MRTNNVVYGTVMCKKGHLGRHKVNTNDHNEPFLMCVHNENVCMGVCMCRTLTG